MFFFQMFDFKSCESDIIEIYSQKHIFFRVKGFKLFVCAISEQEFYIFDIQGV